MQALVDSLADNSSSGGGNNRNSDNTKTEQALVISIQDFQRNFGANCEERQLARAFHFQELSNTLLPSYTRYTLSVLYLNAL